MKKDMLGRDLQVGDYVIYFTGGDGTFHEDLHELTSETPQRFKGFSQANYDNSMKHYDQSDWFNNVMSDADRKRLRSRKYHENIFVPHNCLKVTKEFLEGTKYDGKI